MAGSELSVGMRGEVTLSRPVSGTVEEPAEILHKLQHFRDQICRNAKILQEIQQSRVLSSQTVRNPAKSTTIPDLTRPAARNPAKSTTIPDLTSQPPARQTHSHKLE
ncbi:hypothetical protein [Paenibacillus borealis]|uniref:hypothetical protein n=1 Tax=Paenibacillus borealis TaxID=160799 RepID=UPI0012FDE98B|nr:hypothetical protein [Paenibacillus borealis]